MLTEGTKLGPYEILSPLGAGGMGEVYRARDSKLDREVAIKVLPDLFSRDPERVQRFQREAKVLASLNHPNIAAIYGFEEADRKNFLVMELVEGETLSERLKAGPMQIEEALSACKQMSEALEAAHERGVIHRDLKPANVIITPEGKLKVLDFGLAKAMSPVDERSGTEIANSPTITADFTRAGTILGTAAYMSPEQARGKPLDKRTDIWSFGCVLYECLGGSRPFEGETATDLIAKILERDPNWEKLPASTPPVVRALIQRCLQKNRKDRLRDIGEAWVVLNGALSGELSGLALTGYDARPQTSAIHRILPWAMCGLLAVGLALSLSGFWSTAAMPSTMPIHLNAEISPDFPLAADTGAQFALSPDGSLLTYVAGSPQNRKLYLRRMGQFESTALTGTSDAKRPFFSPDGKWIAFFTRTRLRKISVSGGTPITLCEVQHNRGGTWGPDGNIVFTPNTSSGLFRVQSAGGTPVELTSLSKEKEERSHRWPRFTPDGKHLVFTSQTFKTDFNGSSIEVLSLDTMKRKVIHLGGSNPLFVPGGYLVFLREATLYGARLDRTTWEFLTPPAPIIEGVQFDSRTGGAQIAFANNGTMLYRPGGQTSASSTLVSIQMDGTVSTLIPEVRSYGTPRFSPDGKQLAVGILRKDATIMDLWLYDMDRKTLGRLTFADSNDRAPVWSPDGERIVFSSTPTNSVSPNMFMRRTDGSDEIQRIQTSDQPQIPYSLDSQGKTLVYGEWHGTTDGDLWTVSLDEGATPQAFLVTPFAEWAAALSPNNKWLAYQSNESGQHEVYIRPFPKAAGKWQVSTSGGKQPAWSPDGSELFFTDDSAMMVVTIDDQTGTPVPGEPVKLADFNPTESVFSRSYDIAPDGKSLVVVQEDGTGKQADQSHLRFVFHWFDELESKIPKSKQ